MKTFEAAFSANEVKRFEIAGRFFRIVSAADNSMNVQWLRRGAIVGEAELVGAFFAVDAGVAGESFDAVLLQSLSAQTVKFAISQWAVEAL